MQINQVFAMPSKNTYTIKPIRELLQEEISGFSIDPFANVSRLCDVNSDINGDADCFVQHDALDFIECHKKGEVDTVLFDPPYSPRQVSECYKAVGIKVDNLMTSARFWAKLKDAVAEVVPVGGKVISFGWNSMGMGKKRGFEKTRILLVSHGGSHNDTIVTVETKVRGDVTPSYAFKFVEVLEGKMPRFCTDVLHLPRFQEKKN